MFDFLFGVWAIVAALMPTLIRVAVLSGLKSEFGPLAWTMIVLFWPVTFPVFGTIGYLHGR